MNAKTKQRKNQVNPANIFEGDEMAKKSDAILQGLQAHSRHDLETHGKFDKNAKLSFISDDMLIVGCDIGSGTHYMRAIDTRGRELSRKPFPFSNTEERFLAAKDWLAWLPQMARNRSCLDLNRQDITGSAWRAGSSQTGLGR